MRVCVCVACGSGGTKPECFFQAVGEDAKDRIEALGGTWFVITVTRMVLVALLLGGITLAQMLLKRCAARRGSTLRMPSRQRCNLPALSAPREVPACSAERRRCCHEASPKSVP